MINHSIPSFSEALQTVGMRGLHLRNGLEFMSKHFRELENTQQRGKKNPIPDDSKGTKTMEAKDQVQLI